METLLTFELSTLACDPTRWKWKTAGECVDGSECCTRSSVVRTTEHCTRSCRTAWSKHDGVESCTSTDEKRMLADQNGLGKPPYVWAKKVGNCVGCVPERTWSFVVCSGVAVRCHSDSSCAGVPELEAEMSTEIENDGQLFMELPTLTDGESFDVVMSAGGDHGFDSWRKLHRRWDPDTAGRARSLLMEILSPSRVKLPELMGAIERMEDLVRTLLWSTRCPRKREQSCGGHSHEFP